MSDGDFQKPNVGLAEEFIASVGGEDQLGTQLREVNERYGNRPLVYEPKKAEVAMKYDGAKPDYSLVEKLFLEGIAQVMTYGAKKYTRNNWKLFEREDWWRYYSALIRHVEAIRAGQTVDPESGLSHFYHAACNLMMWDWLVHNKKEKNGYTEVSNHNREDSSIS